MNIIPKSIDKFKKGLSILLIGSTLVTLPKTVKASNSNDSSITENQVNSEITYVMENDSYYGIKTNKSLNETFIDKARFLLGEETYNNYYVTDERIFELQTQFEKMYGKDTFLKLKEFEIRSMNLSQDKLEIEYGNLGLNIDYENRQMSIFPNSDFNIQRKNTIYALTLKQQAIKNIISNQMDTFNTLYEMNEFTSKCLGNAFLNESFKNPATVFDKYTQNILNPIVARIDVNSDGNITDFDAIDFGKYQNYNLIKNNQITYNFFPDSKSPVKRSK